jgi:hypothetical protein
LLWEQDVGGSNPLAPTKITIFIPIFLKTQNQILGQYWCAPCNPTYCARKATPPFFLRHFDLHQDYCFCPSFSGIIFPSGFQAVDWEKPLKRLFKP